MGRPQNQEMCADHPLTGHMPSLRTCGTCACQSLSPSHWWTTQVSRHLQSLPGISCPRSVQIQPQDNSGIKASTVFARYFVSKECADPTPLVNLWLRLSDFQQVKQKYLALPQDKVCASLGPQPILQSGLSYAIRPRLRPWLLTAECNPRCYCAQISVRRWRG